MEERVLECRTDQTFWWFDSGEGREGAGMTWRSALSPGIRRSIDWKAGTIWLSSGGWMEALILGCAKFEMPDIAGLFSP